MNEPTTPPNIDAAAHTSSKPTSESHSPESRHPTRERRRSRARPGVSLLAQGEAQMWLTGGALALAITMIAGLLTLVFVQGVSTFWPGPLVQVTLRDGSQVLGEVTRTEGYVLNRDTVANLTSATADAARAYLGERDAAATSRRLFRTGNFDLTQTHFRWVSDYELQASGESLPEWALVLERREWGRFYGTPAALTIRHPRPITPEEQDGELLAAWLSANIERLEESRRGAATEALDAFRERLQTRRATLARQFTSDATGPGRWSAVMADGQNVPLAELTAMSSFDELQQTWTEPAEIWTQVETRHPEVAARLAERIKMERHEIGELNRRIEDARLDVRSAELATGHALAEPLEELRQLRVQLAAEDHELNDIERALSATLGGEDSPILFDAGRQLLASARKELAEQQVETRQRCETLEAELRSAPASLRAAAERFLEVQREAEQSTEVLQKQIQRLDEENARYVLRMTTADGASAEIPLGTVVRAFPANRLSTFDGLRVFASRWWEFLADEPREANSEGGVFPAIFGTVAMTLIMSLVVVPFGVLAALYLREYARGGLIVSAVRISINNLAGVPSIVFGVFGLGFFCYLVGAFVDGGTANTGLSAWPPYSWYLGLGVLAILAVAAFALGMSGASGRLAERKSLLVSRAAMMLWVASTLLLAWLIFVNPYFGGLFAARLPNPTMGKGGLLWSSLTLALLTLPVVIVATEEALSAVPNSMREGSYACGAGKWQTIRRIVVPQAMPGIMTGMILAMARGAGEVAPLMLVGAVKLAPELPVDGAYPFVHPERSFMHLGFHIYDLGFQSQNSEAAKPMVFTTTLLLITLVAVLNIVAVWLRGRLRQRYRPGQF